MEKYCNKALEVEANACFLVLITWYQDLVKRNLSVSQLRHGTYQTSELDIDSLNLVDVWKEWKEAWELYRISSGVHEKDDAIQIATIQSIPGIKARRVLKTLPNIPGDVTERTVGGILTALETYCVPRKNTTYERYVFRITIHEDRSFDIFVTDLRRKADYCDFGAIKDSLIRDQIGVGINDPKLRERLLRETDLTLEKAIKLCRITEQSQEQSKIFISPTTQTGSIDAVRKTEPPVDITKSKNEDSRRIMKCKFCATSHVRGNCPAYGATCHNCNGRNHYARCCFKSKNGTEERRVRLVEVEENENNELLEGLYIEEIQGSARRNIQSDLLVNDIPVSFKLVTGAECNVISLALANDLNAQVQPTSMLLKRECPLRPSHIENIWHMLKNQNFSYSSQRYPRVSLETCVIFFLKYSF